MRNYEAIVIVTNDGSEADALKVPPRPSLEAGSQPPAHHDQERP